MTIMLGAIAVSTLVAGIAVGLAIYFSSQDREQAKAIEKAINYKPPSVLTNGKKASMTGRVTTAPVMVNEIDKMP